MEWSTKTTMALKLNSWNHTYVTKYLSGELSMIVCGEISMTVCGDS